MASQRILLHQKHHANLSPLSHFNLNIKSINLDKNAWNATPHDFALFSFDYCDTRAILSIWLIESIVLYSHIDISTHVYPLYLCCKRYVIVIYNHPPSPSSPPPIFDPQMRGGNRNRCGSRITACGINTSSRRVHDVRTTRSHDMSTLQHNRECSTASAGNFATWFVNEMSHCDAI